MCGLASRCRSHHDDLAPAGRPHPSAIGSFLWPHRCRRPSPRNPGGRPCCQDSGEGRGEMTAGVQVEVAIHALAPPPLSSFPDFCRSGTTRHHWMLHTGEAIRPLSRSFRPTPGLWLQQPGHPSICELATVPARSTQTRTWRACSVRLPVRIERIHGAHCHWQVRAVTVPVTAASASSTGPVPS